MTKRGSNYLTIEGRKTRFKYIRFLVSIISFGIYPLLIRNCQKISIYIETVQCSITEATHILVMHGMASELCKVRYFFFPYASLKLKRFIVEKEIRFFETNGIRLFFDAKARKYVLHENKINTQAEATTNERGIMDDVNKKVVIEYKAKDISKLHKGKYEVDSGYVKYFYSVNSLEKYVLYGTNSTDVRPRSSCAIIKDLVLCPLFLYSLFGIFQWFAIDYFMYSLIILVLTIYSFAVDFLREIDKNKKLQSLEKIERNFIVQRDGTWVEIDYKDIFPGDLIYIDTVDDFPCDARIIKGEVIVDESFLTGEAVPLFKVRNSSNNTIYSGTRVLKSLGENLDLDEAGNDIINSQVKVKVIKKRPVKRGVKHIDDALTHDIADMKDINLTIDAEKGTKIDNSNDIDKIHNNLNDKCENNICIVNIVDSNINSSENMHNNEDKILKSTKIDEKNTTHSSKSREGAIGVVVSTGYETAKGSLIKNIRTDIDCRGIFETHINIIIIATLIFGILSSIFMFLYLYMLRKSKSKTSYNYSIDLLLCLLTPALPTIIWIGLNIAVTRLKKQNIICNDIRRINIAGVTDLIVFDKTGTLTEDGLDFHCIDNIGSEFYTLKEIRKEKLIREAISVCHSVYEVDNELIGDPLDMKMFIFSQSEIITLNDRRVIKLDTSSKFEGPILKELNEEQDAIHYYKRESEPDKHGKSIDVVRICEFDNKLRRMSVVVKNESTNTVFVKGSPDSLQSLIKDLPEDYFDVVNDYALDGLRILAMCYKEFEDEDFYKFHNVCNYPLGSKDDEKITDLKKNINSIKIKDKEENKMENTINDEDSTTRIKLDISSLKREDLESDLTFLCFIVFGNKLKDETKGTLECLHKANIKIMMATGDNILTAISVGRQSKLIDKFIPVIFPVLDGKAKTIFDADWLCIGDENLVFDKIKLTLHKGNDRLSYDEFYVACEGREYEMMRRENNEFYKFILEKGVIFAMMNPDQKKELMIDYKTLGYSTMFCGDGANDCGALRSSDIGLALAESEASIASRFTSTVKNISSCTTLLMECRCVLNNTFSLFMFTLITSYTQFAVIALLTCFNLQISNWMAVFSDIVLILPLGYIIMDFERASKLHPKRPDLRPLAYDNIIRITAFFVVDIMIIMGLFLFQKSQIIKPDTADTFITKSIPATCIFFLQNISILQNCFLITNGSPHSESKIRNKKFIGFIIFTFVFICGILLVNILLPKNNLINQFFEFEQLTLPTCGYLILVICLNSLIKKILSKVLK